jgi:hypothetical protein
MKRLIIAAMAAVGLGGCIAVPVGDPYYGGPAYYPPVVSFGVGVHGGHYQGHHHHRYGYRRW